MRAVRSDEIYEALFDDDAFSRLPLLVAEIAGGRSGLLQWRHSEGAHEIFGSSYFTSEIVEQMPATMPHDPWTMIALRHPNRLLRMDQFISQAAYEASIPYNELLRPHGDDTTQCMAIALSTGAGFGGISVHRGRRDRPFEAEDQNALSANLHHLGLVLRMRGELSATRNAARSAQTVTDSLALAIVTVRADQRILSANAMADAALRRADGLVVSAGRLIAVSHEAANRLARCVAMATSPTQPTATGLLIERDGNNSAYQLNVAPLTGDGGARSAIVIWRDPDARDPTLTMRLRMLFRLSQAEAEIAAELGAGRSIAEITSSRDVRPSTMTSQLKSILAKTGCTRHAQVAALVAALPTLRVP